MSDSNRNERYSDWLVRAAFAVLILITAAGGLYGLSKQVSYEQTAENHAQEYTRNAGEKANQACLTLPRSQQSQCLVDTKREQDDQGRDKHREYDDLVAQQTSALWTKIMGLAAITGMILSVVGVWLIYATFQETRAANDIAKDDQRPWIDIEIVDVSMSSSTETFDLTANIRIANRGQSPALNVESRARIAVSRGKDDSVQGEYFPEGEYTRITHNLLPSGTGEDILFPKIEIEKIPMVQVYVGQGEDLKKVAGPHFVPTLEVMVDYHRGTSLRPAKTTKKFTISEDEDRLYVGRRVAIPIHLGKVPLPQPKAIEHGIAEIT
ncbi:MAG: hypothetical protein WBL74_08070 [Novosphingobium sp.]|uniref:hypothetical protein n=1 Tax=Novosphingobium sp. TaxID=1874826 RepID=UPI003C7D8877